ncbi:MAG: response regulator [Verrucomicrobia bacterium]|jgi:CheY-like chemotaxis protein|nr:response regulator [Verrucomicrobiota bacterium]
MTKAERKTVAIVDDNPEFLALAAELVRSMSGGRWEVTACASGGDALALLQKSPVDLMALDVNMPVLDGVQLLGLLQRRFPAVLKVVLTGEASPEQRAACLTAGAELILDKPLGADGWRNVYAALDSLLHAPKEEGFRGVLRRVSLPDVIQMECLAGNSSILEITGAGMRGRLYIRSGQMIHAEIGDLTGIDALNNILCWPGGSFHLLPFADPGRQTVSGQWEFLLMEAARLKDESASAAAAAPVTLPDAAAIDAFSIQPQWLDSPPEAKSAPGHALVPPPAARGEGAAAETITGTRPVIKETLICSLQGDVLYEWSCPNPTERIALLEFISRRSSAMAASLPLGRFERFESVDKGIRCVTKLDGERALFVRIQSVLSTGPDRSVTS